jgi:hypothetical protein
MKGGGRGGGTPTITGTPTIPAASGTSGTLVIAGALCKTMKISLNALIVQQKLTKNNRTKSHKMNVFQENIESDLMPMYLRLLCLAVIATFERGVFSIRELGTALLGILEVPWRLWVGLRRTCGGPQCLLNVCLKGTVSCVFLKIRKC